MDDFSLQVKPLAHLLIASGGVNCKSALMINKKYCNFLNDMKCFSENLHFSPTAENKK
jgi:hypothetical protein